VVQRFFGQIARAARVLGARHGGEHRGGGERRPSGGRVEPCVGACGSRPRAARSGQAPGQERESDREERFGALAGAPHADKKYPSSRRRGTLADDARAGRTAARGVAERR
jgi:hypothetical protein